MISKETGEAIEILNRMDLKVAVPPRFQPPSPYKGDIATMVIPSYIHIPSILSSLLLEIQSKEQEIQDIKRAAKILLGIKNENVN